MKSGKFVVNALKCFIKIDIKKRRPYYPPHTFREWINVPYVDDGDMHHAYDFYLANEENRKHVCLIDIHGGSYIIGDHQDNYPFAYEFLKRGYDVCLTDYVPNDGKRGTFDLVKDVIDNILHFMKNKDKFDLAKDRFVIVGDSAGAHFALLIAELFNNKKAAKGLGLELPDIDISSVVLICPVYDYENLGKWNMTNSALKRMLGPSYHDAEMRKKLSPNTYIESFNLPIFVSTCKHDFIREESLHAYSDLKDRNNFVFVDIDSDSKKVRHVHNVTHPNLEESIKVNDAIDQFINKNL